MLLPAYLVLRVRSCQSSTEKRVCGEQEATLSLAQGGVAKVFLWCQLCGWAIASLWGSRGSSAVSAAMSLLCPSLWYGWNRGHTESQGPHPPLLAMRQIRTHSPCWVVSLSDSSWALLNPDLESGNGSWSKALCDELGSSPRHPSKKMLQQRAWDPTCEPVGSWVLSLIQPMSSLSQRIKGRPVRWLSG